jgi:hydrogenase maturation protease
LIWDLGFGAPGTPTRLDRERLPRYLATRISPHQVDLRDVLGLAELRGTLPDHTVALGLQPEHVEMGFGLSDVVAARLDDLVDSAADLLTTWGHPCRARAEPAVRA